MFDDESITVIGYKLKSQTLMPEINSNINLIYIKSSFNLS